MGKNKKKINSVFKVAGAKSLKLKAKARAVKSDLKNINVKNKNKVLEIDKALVQLEDKVRQTAVQEKKKSEVSTSQLPTRNNETALEAEKQSEEIMKELDTMQL